MAGSFAIIIYFISIFPYVQSQCACSSHPIDGYRCSGYSTECTGSFICTAGLPCNIICIEEESCYEAIVYSNGASQLILHCDEEFACAYSTVHCEDGDLCTIRCNGNYACVEENTAYVSTTSTYECIDVDENTAFKCIDAIKITYVDPLPTEIPTQSPSNSPSSEPTMKQPFTEQTTQIPTIVPSASPITSNPTTNKPTKTPFSHPIIVPTHDPSKQPSESPITSKPTVQLPTISNKDLIVKVTYSTLRSTLTNEQQVDRQTTELPVSKQSISIADAADSLFIWSMVIATCAAILIFFCILAFFCFRLYRRRKNAESNLIGLGSLSPSSAAHDIQSTNTANSEVNDTSGKLETIENVHTKKTNHRKDEETDEDLYVSKGEEIDETKRYRSMSNAAINDCDIEGIHIQETMRDTSSETNHVKTSATPMTPHDDV